MVRALVLVRGQAQGYVMMYVTDSLRGRLLRLSLSSIFSRLVAEEEVGREDVGPAQIFGETLRHYRQKILLSTLTPVSFLWERLLQQISAQAAIYIPYFETGNLSKIWRRHYR